MTGEQTTTATTFHSLLNCPQCSRASVTLADRLPFLSGEREPTSPQRQDDSVTPGFSPSCAAGDEGSDPISIEGAAENLPGVGKQGQDDSEAPVVWSRIKLAIDDVCVEKVVEKDALGSTAKGAMAVSCREVRQRGRGGTGVSRAIPATPPYVRIATPPTENVVVALFP